VILGQGAPEAAPDEPEANNAPAPEGDDAAPAAAEPAGAPPAGQPAGPPPEAVQKLQRAMIRMASARTEAERVAAQEELRIAANLQDAPVTAEPDEYDRAVSALEPELLEAMSGETIDEKRKNLSYYDKLGERNFAKAAKRIEAIAEKRALDAVTRTFTALGLTPDNLKGMVEASRDAEWRPHLDDLGPEASKFLPQAKALREKFAKIGEELSHEDALMMASRGKITAVPATPAPRRNTGPVVPSAEDGPPPRAGQKHAGRAMTNAEIMASFHRAQATKSSPNGAIGGKLQPGSFR